MGGGECGIFTTSSAYIGNLTKTADGKFAWGTGSLPRWPASRTGNSIIGGATLWVMKGAKPEEYKGVAQFFKYLASTENQAWWAEVTGYIPLTQAAVKAMEKSGVYTKSPALKTAVNQMNAGKTTANSQGLRLGNYGSIRDAIEEQMENVFAGKKTAKQGLDDAVAKSNDDPEGVRRHLQVAVAGAAGDEADGLSQPLAAVRAGGAADRHHDRLLLTGRRWTRCGCRSTGPRPSATG